MAAQDADLLQPQPGFVKFHRNLAPAALRDVEDDDPAVDRLFQYADEPFVGRGVARAECLQHHGPQPRSREHRPQDIFAQPREKLDDFDSVGQAGGDAQFRRDFRRVEDRREVIGDVNPHLGQGRVVVGTEGAQRLGAAFGGTVGAEQPVLEIERHFGYLGASADVRPRDLDGRDEVFAAVRAQHADRDLAAGENHGLGQVFEHETQCRCGVGHGVRAVQYDEPVVAGVVVADQLGQRRPVCRGDVRRVDHGIHRQHVDVHVEPLERREFIVDAAEVERHQGAGFGIVLHADGTARIDDQDRRFHRMVLWCYIPKIRLAFAVVAAATSPGGSPFSSATFSHTNRT